MNDAPQPDPAPAAHPPKKHKRSITDILSLTASAIVIVGSIFGAWLFMDSYFAQKEELNTANNKIAALEVENKRLVLTNIQKVRIEANRALWILEESQNLNRIDVLDGRVTAEKLRLIKLREDNDAVRIVEAEENIDAWKKQITRLEDRNKIISDQIKALNISDLTN